MNKLSGIIVLASLLNGIFIAQNLLGQTRATTIAVNDYRPLAAAVSQLEQLSTIPINFEDVRFDFPGDQIDVTAQNVTPASQQLALQEGLGPVKDIAPRGGPLSATIAVDAASGKLKDANALAAALNSVLSAYAGSNLPGAFSVENYNGAFFVAPTAMRDASGATVAVSSVLSTPITLSVKQGIAAEVLNQILSQVYKRSGFKIEAGSVPMNGLAMGRVTFDAVQEPANHVLMWLLNSLLGYGPVLPPSSPSLAYRVFYVPQLKSYLFNIFEVGVQLNTHINRPAAPVQPSGPPAVWSVPTKP
jgi:hypothetical protein